MDDVWNWDGDFGGEGEDYGFLNTSESEVEEEESEEGEKLDEVGEGNGSGSSSEYSEGDEESEETEDKESEWSSEEDERGNYPVENDGESASDSSSNKRVKEDPIDWLSALSDDILIHILSYLRFKRAVVTSVLSKRWQYLWTELPRLTFHERSNKMKKTRELVCQAHRTLALRSRNCLDVLEIRFGYNKCFASDVNVWVEYVVRNKVQTLNLMLRYRGYMYKLPQAMYSCSSLTWLSLQACVVVPRRTIEWESLIHLAIEYAELRKHVIQKILSGCPVLHSLDLRECWGFKCLNIESQSLHKLSLIECMDERAGPSLRISAPYLESFDVWSFPIDEKKLRLKNTQSLVRAKIDFRWSVSSLREQCNLMNFFESIEHVEELELGPQAVQAVSVVVAHQNGISESSRKYLMLDVWRDEESITGIVGMLGSSPVLETLVVQSSDYYKEHIGTFGSVSKEDLDGDLLNLKTVELISYADPKLGGEPMLTLARIILKRAPALEKMVIDDSENLTNCSPDDSIKMSETLLGYPKSSQKAEIIFRNDCANCSPPEIIC